MMVKRQNELRRGGLIDLDLEKASILGGHHTTEHHADRFVFPNPDKRRLITTATPLFPRSHSLLVDIVELLIRCAFHGHSHGDCHLLGILISAVAPAMLAKEPYVWRIP